MRVFYTPRYYADIGEGHVFPIRKFELVYDRLLAEGTLPSEGLTEPEPASLDDVLLVLTEEYMTKLCNGTLDEARSAPPGFAVPGVTCSTIISTQQVVPSLSKRSSGIRKSP